MSRRLSDSIFQGRSTDAMVVDDAYQISTGETRNSVYDSAKSVFSDAIKGLGTNKNSVNELTRLIMDARNGTVDKQDMFTRALGAMGTSLPGLLGTMGGALKNQLAGVAGTMIGPDAQKAVEVLYNNIPLLVSTTNVKDTADLISLVQELTGNSELASLINVEAESAVIAGIAGALMDYGIGDLVDDVVNMSRSDTVKMNALSYLSSQSVAGADLDTINKILDQLGLVKFLENNPNAVKDILSAYYLGTDDTPDTYPAKRDKLITTLARIDAHWYQRLRGGNYVLALDAFTVASTDAKKLLTLDDPWRTYLLAGTGRTAQAPADVIKALYPNAYISG